MFNDVRNYIYIVSFCLKIIRGRRYYNLVLNMYLRLKLLSYKNAIVFRIMLNSFIYATETERNMTCKVLDTCNTKYIAHPL
jgi:hypothetical protein